MNDIINNAKIITDKTLWWKVLLGMALGIFLGYLLSPTGGKVIDETSATVAGEWIALPGIIFLSLLKMVVIPLVITSIILGVTASGSLSFLKSIGTKAVLYFVITSFISIAIGVGVVKMIKQP